MGKRTVVQAFGRLWSVEVEGMGERGGGVDKSVAFDESAFIEFVCSVVISDSFLELVRMALEEREAAGVHVLWPTEERRREGILKVWMKVRVKSMAATWDEVNAAYHLADLFDEWRRACEFIKAKVEKEVRENVGADLPDGS